MKLSLVNLAPLKEVEFDSPAPEGMDIPNFDSLVDALKWKNDLENYSMDLEHELKHAQRKFDDELSGQYERGAEPEGGPIQQKIAGELNQMKSNIQIFKKELNTVLAKLDYFDQNYLGERTDAISTARALPNDDRDEEDERNDQNLAQDDTRFERMNEDKELDPYQKSIAAKWDEETKEGGEFDTTRELEKNDVKQFMANMAAKTAFLTKLRDDGKFNKKTPPSDDKIEMWVIKPKIPGFKIAGMLKPETNELKEMKKSNNKNLLIERFQELAGIKPLYENEDRKADHASFEFDNYTDDGSIPLPTAGWWEDGTEMTEDELEAYYDKMGDSTMHTIMHDNLGEGEDLRLEPEEEDSYRDMIKGKYSDDDLKLEPEIDETMQQGDDNTISNAWDALPEDEQLNILGDAKSGRADYSDLEKSFDTLKSEIPDFESIVAEYLGIDEGSCGYSQEAPGGEELDTPGGTQGMDADERTRGMLKIFIQKEIKKLKEGEPGDFDRDLEDLLGKDDFAKATSNEVPGLGDTVIDDKTDITTSKKTFMQMMMQFTDEPFLIETGLKLYDAWANGEGGLKPSRILDILKQSSSN